MKLKLFLLPMLAVLLSVSLYSCSDDDSPKSGKEQAEYIKERITKNSKKFFTKVDNTEGQYLMGTENAQKAQSCCEHLLGIQWNGQKYTYTLNDEMGSVVITPNPKEGIYIRLLFDIEGISTFTLDIASRAYYENNNYVFKPAEGMDML